jgi:ABC-2 type transport system permease protein
MTGILAVARRELGQYFATPVGWLCICGFLLVTGFFYAFMMSEYSVQATQMAMSPYGGEQMNVNEALIPYIFDNWKVILLFICPALAMRLFSEDVRQRSFELLLASPLSSAEIVIGKYLGILSFLAVMFASTLHYVGILFWLTSPDPGVILAGYLSMFLLSAGFAAGGMLASALTENQVVAFVLSFGFLLVLWVLTWTESLGSGDVWKAVSYASILSHSQQLGKGLLHLKDAIYFTSFIGFFLFATQQQVESTRWR